jgi:tRNA threonylcarbamoyladenosine biosynthesis protein TsaE
LENLETSDQATVVGLYGNLGAGKTTFVKEIAKQLGVKQEITSPTFTLLKNFEFKNQKFDKLTHIDLYRIEDIEEIKILDLENLFKEKGSLILIEWIDKIENQLKEDFIKVKIEHKDEDSRLFEIQNV